MSSILIFFPAYAYAGVLVQLDLRALCVNHILFGVETNRLSHAQVFWFNWASERGLRLDFARLLLAKQRHDVAQQIIGNMYVHTPAPLYSLFEGPFLFASGRHTETGEEK